MKNLILMHKNTNSTADFKIPLSRANEVFANVPSDLYCIKLLVMITDGAKGTTWLTVLYVLFDGPATNLRHAWLIDHHWWAIEAVVFEVGTRKKQVQKSIALCFSNFSFFLLFDMQMCRQIFHG